MSAVRKPRNSQLFTIRVWSEELGDGKTEWRATVYHVTTGEQRHVRDGAALVAFLVAKLQTPDDDEKRPS